MRRSGVAIRCCHSHLPCATIRLPNNSQWRPINSSCCRAADFEETVLAQAEGNELRTVIAGYHWFGDWGRDTMISLEGLTLCTGRYREAGAILRTFSNYVRDGLLPNLFPEGERQALYHTVDATLWYFHAISRYIATTGPITILTLIVPGAAVDHRSSLKGTHYNIHVDPNDGLVAAAAEGYQLTWMDAKVDGWVVTPASRQAS